MENREDITNYASSMLAGSRKRKDDQYRAFKNDRDRMASEARKRERKNLLYGYGAKALLSIGNTMVRQSTENFLNQEKLLQNNIKFKSAVNGATDRNNQRQEALSYEGGEAEYYRAKAAAEITTAFNKAIPDSYSATQRAQLLYNESVEAGKQLQKLYADSADQDRLLIERVGEDGAEAYNKALIAGRGTDIGSTLYRKFKGLFKKGGDPLDNSLKESEELMNIAGGVKAYGELRREGLSPFRSKEKVAEWTAAAGGMPLQIESSKLVEIKSSFTPEFGDGKPVATTKTFREIKYKNNPVPKYIDLQTQSEVTSSDIANVTAASIVLKNNSTEIKQLKVATAQNLSKDDLDVLGTYNSLLVEDATDKDRVIDVADNQYAKMYITGQHLKSRYGFRPKQAEVLAAKMHVINTKTMIDTKGWGTTANNENNLLTDKYGSHPMVAYMAILDIKENSPVSVSFSPKTKKALLTDYAKNISFYDSRLSTEAQKNLRTLIAERPEAAMAFENILKGSEEPPTVPEPVVSTSTSTTPVAAPKTYTEDEINKALKYHFRTNSSKQKAALAGNLDQKTQIFNAVGGQSILDSDSRKQARTDKLVKAFKSASQKQKAINGLSATDKLVYDSLKSKSEKEKFLADKSGAV